MGWAFLYVAFGVVALWLLGEVLFQYKARLRWRALAFTGFLCVVVGALVPSILVIGAGIAAFATGQTFVTLSHRRGFVTGWALGGGPGTSRRRRGGQGSDGDPEQDGYAYEDGYPDGPHEREAYGDTGQYGQYSPAGQESEVEQTLVGHGADGAFARGGYDPARYEPDDVFTPGGYPTQTFPAAGYAGNGHHDSDYPAHGYDQGTYDPAAYAAFDGNGNGGGYGPDYGLYEGPGGHDGFGDGAGAGHTGPPPPPPQEQPVPVYQPGPLPGETAEFVFGQGIVDPAGAGAGAASGHRGTYQGVPEPSYDAGGQQQAAGYTDPFGGYDAGGPYPGAPYGGYTDDGLGGFGQGGQAAQAGAGYGGAPQAPYDPYGGYGPGYDDGYGGQQPYADPGPQGGAWVPQQRDTGEPLPPEQQTYPSYQPYGHGGDPAGNGYYYDDQQGTY